MNFVIRALALLSLSTLVFGMSSKTFTWEAPTQRENGDALPSGEIQEYIIRCGTETGGPYTAFRFETNANVNEYASDEVFDPGTYFCIARTKDTEGLISENSNEVNFTVGRCEATDCRPRPPVLSVTP